MGGGFYVLLTHVCALYAQSYQLAIRQADGISQYVPVSKIVEMSIVDNPTFDYYGFIEADGTVSNTDNTSWRYTDYIAITRNQVDSIRICALFGNPYGGGLAYYDKDKNHISSCYKLNDKYNDNTVQVINDTDIPNRTGYIRACSYTKGITEPYINIYYKDNANVSDESSDVCNHIVDSIAQQLGSIQSQMRKRIDITISDNEIEIFNKMWNAFNQGNCDVYWESGVYVFSNIYLYMRDEMKWTWTMGLPVGGNNRYFFSHSVLIANRPTGYHNEMNILDCKASVQSYELHDGTLINNGGMYCVHDEAAGKTGFYKHVYKNMCMEYHIGTSTPTFQKCIGGGVGQNGIVIIDNCVFTTDITSNVLDVSWHGNLANDYPCRMSWMVSNSYFSKGFSLDGEAKDSDSFHVLFSGNSVSGYAGIPSGMNWIVRQFGNEIR